MQTPPLRLVEGRFFIDNSSINALLECPRQYYYAHSLKRIPGTARPALVFGGAVHAALEAIYNAGFGFGLASDKALELGVAAMSKHFDENPTETEDYRNLTFGVEKLRKYIEVYSCEEFLMLMINKKPLVEHSFSIDFATMRTNHPLLPVDLPISYTGRIDLGVEKDNGIYTVDTKTSSRMGEWFFKKEAVSAQHEGYGWVLRESLGIIPRGFCINGIFTGKPTRKNKDTGEEAPLKRAVAIDTDYQRLWTDYVEGQLEAWRDNVCCHLEELLWHASRDKFPQRKISCVREYGPCNYYETCKLPEHNRLEWLATPLFVDNTWSPLKTPTAPSA